MIFVNRSPLLPTGVSLLLVGLVQVAAAEEETPKRAPWEVTLGAGIVNMPEYAGSDESETRGLPLVSVRYKRFFLGGAPGSGSPGGIGAYLYDGEAWRVGAVVSTDPVEPREESDDESLRGLGDVDRAIRAGVFASYRNRWLTLSTNVTTDVSDEQQGTIANFDAESVYRPTARLILSGGPGITWSDQEYVQTLFGITPDQSVRSGLAEYRTDAGVSSARVSLSAQYLFTRHWFLGARMTASQLQGDAADSPIVKEKGQNFYAVFTGYRF